MTTLLANGCSFTAGTDSVAEERYNNDISWAKFLAESYEMEYVNIAEPGSGNEHIMLSTIEWVEKNKHVDDVFVCILWSGFNRHMFWDGKKHMNHSVYSINRLGIKGDVAEYINIKTLMEPLDYSLYKNLFYMYMTAQFLESKNIPYCFMNSLDMFIDPYNSLITDDVRPIYLNMLELYGFDRIDRHMGFMTPNDRYVHYLKEIKKIPNAPYGTKTHWGVEGNKAYAELVMEHIKNVGIRTKRI